MYEKTQHDMEGYKQRIQEKTQYEADKYKKGICSNTTQNITFIADKLSYK